MTRLLDNGGWLGNILSQNVSLNEIRKPYSGFMRDEILRWYRKYLCEER